MGKLTDILNGNGGWIDDNWGDITAAPDFGTPVPAGKYAAHLKLLEPFNAKTKGTPGVKCHFEVVDGDFKGRRLWYDIWLTDAAKSQAVRDFGKLGIRNRQQLEQPIPQWIRCLLTVVIRKNDEGVEFNVVKTFEVAGIDKPEADPFAPADTEGEPPNEGF